MKQKTDAQKEIARRALAKYAKNHPDRIKQKEARWRAALTDSYVKSSIRNSFKGEITQGMIEERRKQIIEFRERKKLKAEMGNEWNKMLMRAWRRANPDKCEKYVSPPMKPEAREKRSKQLKQIVANLDDDYVRSRISRPKHDVLIPLEMVTDEMIEAKRAELKLQRLIKELKS